MKLFTVPRVCVLGSLFSYVLERWGSFFLSTGNGNMYMSSVSGIARVPNADHEFFSEEFALWRSVGITTLEYKAKH